MKKPIIHGIMAEFGEASELLAAARKAHVAGYREMDAYSPFPIEGMADAIGFHTKLPLLVLIGGIVGAVGGFTMQVYASAIHYPINIGGRPLVSWPSFIPITFELTILFAGLTAVIGMLVLNDFPKPYHPVFNVPRFGFASRDRFFLCIEATDPKFDYHETRLFLESLHPYEIAIVEC